MQRIVYADNAATTPVSKIAFDAMEPYFSQEYGNPSALHLFGHKSKIAVEAARKKIAKSIGALSNEIYFTSGGTESDNWAILGSIDRKNDRGKHIITSSIEHSAIYNVTETLIEQGYEITYLPVNEYGQIDPKDLESAIRKDTVLVSIMMANNEIGTIIKIKELCDIAHKSNILFHTDAVQTTGHIPINVKKLGVDMLSMSSHKFGGPKGIGALYLRLGKSLSPLIIGGGQERGLRSGTTNTTGIIGMAAALEDSVKNMDENIRHITSLRNRLIEGMLEHPNVKLTGDPDNRLPGIASFVIDDINGAVLVGAFSELGICVSAGSACSAGSGEQSRVLLACGYSDELATNSVRFSMDTLNDDNDIDYILEMFPKAIADAKVKLAHLQPYV